MSAIKNIYYCEASSNMKVHNNPRVFVKQSKKMKKKVQLIPNLSASVAQELKFIKRLAGNDSRLSEKTLKNLGKWLQLRSNSSNRAYNKFILCDILFAYS